MQSYSEPPIAPYGVAIEHDGCHRADVDDPAAWGTVEQCAQWIANHLPPKGFGYTFGIMHIDTGRMVSFMIPVPTVAKRIRVSL